MPERTTERRSLYFNACYQACCIVAVINYNDGVLFDWTAYINGVNCEWSREEAVSWVDLHGCKLHKEIAVAIWTNLDASRYRI